MENGNFTCFVLVSIWFAVKCRLEYLDPRKLHDRKMKKSK
jgi:hypothetical protein